MSVSQLAGSTTAEIGGHSVRFCLRRNHVEFSEELENELKKFGSTVSDRLTSLPQDFAERTDAQKTAWATSRTCLVEVLRAESATQKFASLSHTSAASIAICCATRPVGVDIEPTDRIISEAVFFRIGANDERSIGISPVGLWTLKEACFKADAENSNSVMSNYWLAQYDSSSQTALLQRKGTTKRFSAKIFRRDEFTFAAAILGD